MILLFNKPYGVVCQFTGVERATLADYIDVKGVYPAGRLDTDSEGLLVLTDDGRLQNRISHPHHKLPKTYLAQVEGDPTQESLDRLAKGVKLNDGPTLPAKARSIAAPRVAMGTGPAHPLPQTGGRFLDRAHPEGRPQPPGSAHDCGGGASDPEADPLGGGRLEFGRDGTG